MASSTHWQHPPRRDSSPAQYQVSSYIGSSPRKWLLFPRWESPPKHVPYSVATTAPVQTDRAQGLSTLNFIIKASRPGLWATAVWFFLLPRGRSQVFDSIAFWVGLIYVTLPLGLIIYGWNDIADADIDQFNPRKGTFLFGARGSQQQLRRLPLQIALAQTLFAAIFLLLTGPKILIWFSGLIVFTAIYNFPRYG